MKKFHVALLIILMTVFFCSVLHGENRHRLEAIDRANGLTPIEAIGTVYTPPEDDPVLDAARRQYTELQVQQALQQAQPQVRTQAQSNIATSLQINLCIKIALVSLLCGAFLCVLLVFFINKFEKSSQSLALPNHTFYSQTDNNIFDYPYEDIEQAMKL